ncbi:SDR family oxidoreductase [Xanthobacteraceae bacterium Astr-EGSB]|uniref:SDR family oxidoreductase n=1 Tax=Astrobacterium formosum TaxID=3069710 RepID=UPI0027B3ED65|nr:SDR family oxidoreductase [Xanthobacteraceae bacterium Astr-EGSB]
MFALTGASGQLGRLVIDNLLTKVAPSRVAAAVRRPDKAADLAALGVQVRLADYDRPETLADAFAGVERLLLISSSEVGKRASQHRAVIAAAKRAGVKLIVYTSLLHADASPLGLAGEHKESEAALTASGVPFVILRNGWYTENYAASIAPALAHGAFIGAAADGRISSAARADYAEAAAAVLAGESHAGRIYELAGDTSYTLSDFAAELSRQSGKSIPYKNLTEEDYKAALVGAGLPEIFAALYADSDAGAAKGALFDDGRQLSALIGRPTTPLATVIAATLKK